MTATRDELRHLVDQLDDETVPGAAKVLRELAARTHAHGAIRRGSVH